VVEKGGVFKQKELVAGIKPARIAHLSIATAFNFASRT
jgi:hypothetical protein